MVKGVSRRVVVIRSPDLKLFDEAIFIVREDVSKIGGVSQEDILKEAQDVAGKYVRRRPRGRLSRISPPLWAAIGAGITGLAWALSYLF